MTVEGRFLDTAQVAGYLGIHEKQVYTLIQERGLPATKITGKWLFPRHLVDRWLESHVVNMPEPLTFLESASDMLLVAGSDDPLLVNFLALYRQRYPDTLVLQSRAGSSEGLLALRRGLVHAACSHLADPRGGYTTAHIRETVGGDVAVVTFASRTQGLLLQEGNPLGIGDLEAACRGDLRWALREVGTGTRALLDREMDRLGVDADAVLVNAVTTRSHLDTALAVRGGRADVGLGIEAAAGLAGCSFLPLRQERFDLVIRKESFFLPQVQDLVGLMRDPAFQEMSASLAGYDTRESGRLVA